MGFIKFLGLARNEFELFGNGFRNGYGSLGLKFQSETFARRVYQMSNYQTTLVSKSFQTRINSY